MPKHFVYTNTKNNKVVFESLEPNYTSIDMVDKKVLAKTGTDPRLNPALISRKINMVSDDFKIIKQKYRK